MEKEKEISEQKKKKRYIGWLCEHFNENPKIPEKKATSTKLKKVAIRF